MEKRFGPYLLLERIGAGGMGEVFRAVKTGPGGFRKEMAVKLILPHLSRDQSFLDLFSREARLAALLDHPGIVKVFGFEFVQDTAVMEMELVRGVDLRHLLRSLREGEKLPLPVAALILHRAARGLAFAHLPSGRHSAGLVHRDLNPHNILLSCEGEVKLADFGIARAADEGTASGRLRGKIPYMSPEQLRGQKQDPPSDLFSLGILAYQLLCGRHPFQREGDPATMRAILEEDPPSVLPEDGLPEPLADLVLSLLAREPSRRPTALQAATRLEPFLRSDAERELGSRVANLKPEGAAHEIHSLTAPTLLPRRLRWPWFAMVATTTIAGLWLIVEIPRLNTSSESLPVSNPLITEKVREDPARSASQPDHAGTLPVMIATEPAGARLAADGKTLGNAPFRLVLPAESPPLLITASKEGYADISFRVDPADGQGGVKVRLDPLPTGSVRISALPWAQVYHEGTLKGVTPTTVMDLPVGSHHFLLENGPLGVRREIVVDVTQGMNTISVDLTTAGR